MLRLRDIMTTDVVSVSPETSVREAMEVLSRRHVSGAPVVAGGKIVGVVTGNDLMLLASSLPTVDSAERMLFADSPEWNALDEHEVDEVMTRTPLVTLGPDAEVSVAAKLMSLCGIHRILVTEDGCLVGVVSALDIAGVAGRQ
jgi:CBS domain-containing protein